jgi:hypothetical protein
MVSRHSIRGGSGRIPWRPMAPATPGICTRCKMLTFAFDGEDAVDIDLEDYH